MNGGFHTFCSLPLISGEEVIGVLDLIHREDPFSHDEGQLLMQVGRQVAIAVENALAYREVCELKERLATEKLYLEQKSGSIRIPAAWSARVRHSSPLLRRIQIGHVPG